MPLGHTVSIATSKAQLDAGVFEFSFRDERYMPFEGAGAISDWSLSLPKTLRVFDYATISDVILHLTTRRTTTTSWRAGGTPRPGSSTLLSDEFDGKVPLSGGSACATSSPMCSTGLLTQPGPGPRSRFTLDEPLLPDVPRRAGARGAVRRRSRS